MNILIVLLGLLAAAAAVPAHFPRERTVVYKYSADVKAGAMQPANFASQFGIECLLTVNHVHDPTLKNAYRVVMSEVKYGLHNGAVQHFQHIDCMQPIVNEAKDIQNPFMIVHDENGRLQGLKVMGDESKWSVNIKKAIASALQLDLVNIQMQKPMTPHSFINQEDTIHGRCQVAYHVHPHTTEDPSVRNVFMVTKMHELQNCSNFVHFVHNHIEHEKCQLPEENGMTSTSRRTFEIEDQGSSILIRKLIAHGVINYIPAHANADAHYILTNQTFILESTTPQSDVPIQFESLKSAAIIHNINYSKPNTEYVQEAGIDVTNGRHVVNRDHVVTKVKNMLSEAADYSKETQIAERTEDWKYGQTINRIMHVMNFMNKDAFDQVYSELQDAKESKEVTMKNIFLGIVPNVGTTASCLFTLNVIRRKTVSDRRAVMMLAVLPMHVKRPSQKLLAQMEPLLQFSDPTSHEVKRAGVLCFATLIHKTFMHEPFDATNSVVNRYMNQFMDRITGDSSTETKVLYMLAMRNIGLRHILKHLEPIVKGDHPVSNNLKVRLQAISAIRKVIINHPDYTHNLLWPVLSNTKLPVSLRIAAYEGLMQTFSHTARFMNMYWFMVYEKNEHLYNFHVDTMKGIANSVDPCLLHSREMAKKVLRFTRTRHVPGVLSTKFHFDYFNEKFGYGEALKASLILNPRTGFPELGSVEHFEFAARKPSQKWGIHWHINGMAEMVKELNKNVFSTEIHSIIDENMKNLLAKAAAMAPSSDEIDINLFLTLNNHVVTMLHADKDNWKKMVTKLSDWQSLINNYVNDVNWENVFYDNHFEMHVPTDNGLPTVLFTKMPSYDSLKIQAVPSEQGGTKTLKLRLKYVGWKHGEHVLSIYNPFVDIWHSVRKTAALDVAVPVDMTVAYTSATKNLKITLPRLPVTEYSVGGMLTSAKSFVTVTDDKANPIKGSCPQISHYALITNNMDKKEFRKVIDSKDTGLQHKMLINHCEDNHTPVPVMNELFKVFESASKNPSNNMWVAAIMAVRQQIFNNMISSQGATCTNLFRVEPSINHLTSFLEVTGKINTENYVDSKMHIFNGKRIDLLGSMVAKAAGTNEPVRQWIANFNIHMNQGHINNTMKLTVTRSGRDEKNLKICVDGQKDYPIINSDILKVDTGKKETNLKMKIAVGETTGETCVHDDVDLTIFVKGELSQEQKHHMQNDKINGTCIKDIQNPLLNPEGTHVPKTWGCINEAMLHSTLRRYSCDIQSRKPKLPVLLHMVQDMVRLLYQIDPRDTKYVFQFPVLSSSLDMFSVSSSGEHFLLRLPWGHPVWNILMDNTRFSAPGMLNYLDSNIRVCTIHPRMLLTFDNGTIPFEAPQKWTLLTGDYVDKRFSVATRVTGNSKMDVKIFVGKHTMEITNTNSGTMVSVDNNNLNDIDSGAMVPANQPDTYFMKLAKNYEHLMVDSQQVPLMVVHTPNSVTVLVSSKFQGEVSGMCGHMDGTHVDVVPSAITTSHL